jgi:sugar phosphate isomerase/epimerase
MRKFRLGILTDEVSQDIGEAMEFAVQYGLDAIEIRSVNGKAAHLLTDEEINEIGRLAERHGLVVSGIAGPLFKCHMDDPLEVAEHLAMAERLVEVALRLHSRVIRGFTFWAGSPFEQALPEIAAQLKKLIPLLEEAGVTLALEYDPSTQASNARKTAAVLNLLQTPHVQALYDPGNNLWDPDGEIPYPDGYEEIKAHLCHVHLKDARRTPEGVEAVAIGTGEVDYRSLLTRLDQDNYNGYLIVETHYRMNAQLTEEQLKRPAGFAFSEGGREASAHCTEHLLRLLHELGFEENERRAESDEI